MSAQITPTRLALKGDKTLPRELVVTFREGEGLSAHAFPLRRDHSYKSFAFAYRPLIDCRLERGTDLSAKESYALWVGTAGFDVTQTEAQAIHDTFSPVGLRSNWGTP